jgi:thioesterase domain-containing protein
MTLAVTCIVIVLVGIANFFAGMWAERRRSQHGGTGFSRQRHRSNNPQALELEAHMLKTQAPARLLGIRVHACSGTYLALSAPLSLNTNVHGTAFAGSLYSLIVLTCYYAAQSWITSQSDLKDYILVAKSATIQYQRPVTAACDNTIVAKSVLPDQKVLENFRQELVSTAKKGYLQVKGHVNSEDGNVACECMVELCAYQLKEE